MTQPARGFSLLEMMVAITLIGVAFTALFSSISTSIRNVERIGGYEQRLELARAKLAELEMVEVVRPGDRADGVFDDGTVWRLEAVPFLPEDADANATGDFLVRIVLTLEWQGRTSSQTLSVDAIKHVVVQPGAPSFREQLDALR